MPTGTPGHARALAAAGVVAYQPTFVSSPVDAYRSALRAVGEVASTPAPALPFVLGAHLEGPFLSPRWPGAHDAANLRPPDPALMDEFLATGPVTTVTVAPELDGALELIERLVARGVVVSLGHSDADVAAAYAGFDRGARAITHLYNAHRRWQPRDPGIGGAALVRPDVTVQAIFDGVHLAPEAAYAAFLAARGRFALVTDGVAPAGLGPGHYRLGDREIEAGPDAVRLADGRLAGSLLTLDTAVRNLVAAGAPLAAAMDAASGAPARLLGRPDLGALRPGAPAHVVVLDDDLRVTRTLVGGVEAYAG